MYYLMLFHCNNGCKNALQCYVLRTLPAFLLPLLLLLSLKEEFSTDYVDVKFTGYNLIVLFRRHVCNSLLSDRILHTILYTCTFVIYFLIL